MSTTGLRGAVNARILGAGSAVGIVTGIVLITILGGSVATTAGVLLVILAFVVLLLSVGLFLADE